jgi:biotin-[acetyl-CoA-carboxylase] ligase BirA-like protein
MRLLTDSPAELAPFVGAAQWSPERATGLPPSEQTIWGAAGGGPELTTADLADADPAGFWALAAVVRETPRSQYDALHEALGEGLRLPGPTACLALGGRGFHGQRGRAWQAEPDNLFLTAALAPRLPVERLVPALTMLPAVAVVDAICAAGGPGVAPGIKWVNDILIDGRKVGGVLAATHVRERLVESAVLGIGVNVARAPRLEPTPFVPEAGCLREAGVAVALGAFFLCVLACLARRYGELVDRGPGPLLEAYRARSLVVGRRVGLSEDGRAPDGRPDPAPIVVGVVQSIEPDLSLRLEGRAEPVRHGRLFLDPGGGPASEQQSSATTLDHARLAAGGARDAGPRAGHRP